MRTMEYQEKRKRRGALKYRLKRRAKEVLKVVKKYRGTKITSLLDIGCADGLILNLLSQGLAISLSVGIDSSRELLRTNANPGIRMIQGQAENLPFRNEEFEVIIATAVIEHLLQPTRMIKECHRLLKRGGIFIITTPVPFWDKIARKTGLLKEKGHQKTFSLSALKALLTSQDFKILKAKKFMFSSIGFPFEEEIEKILYKLKSDFLLANQIIVGSK
ncbi:MAG TPA: methyltransferase domain-containing protein [bacterium]|nr:methyltransferase domain-containing protein [bacterium]